MAIEGIDDSVELDLQLRIMASVLYTKLAERFNILTVFAMQQDLQGYLFRLDCP